MLMNILMLIVAAMAALGSYRQSRMTRATGNKGVANLWMVAAFFCGIIAIAEFVALFV